MRRGARCRPWSVSEVRYLVESAGRVPKRDICRHLRRSSRSVECKAYHLRKEGVPVDLRHHEPRLSSCPACGRLSGRMGRDGFCEPCRRRAQLAEVHARIAELLALLPPEERATYEATEAEVESRRDPMPPPPPTAGLSYYAMARAEEAHELACEEALTRNLMREVKAAQKRKERVEKKVRSMRV